MRPTDFLRSQCQADWDKVTEHKFCAQLADGSLNIQKMHWYLAQDYQFIDGFVRLLATAIAHAPTLKDSVPAAQFMALITGPENDYFQRSFSALEMPLAEQNPQPDSVTSAFQQLMKTARESGEYSQMLAVLVVAEWIYLSWAQRYVDYDKSLPFWFAQWIDLHSGAGFEAVVEYLRSQLDQEWERLDALQHQQVIATFNKAVACELDFFDAAYSDR